MFQRPLQLLAGALFLLGVSCFESAAANASPIDAGALDGLWSGSWGLQIDRDGVVHQPVKADLFIQGSDVEWAGFPEPSKLTGTIRVDTKQIRITPAAEAGSRPADTIVYAYEIKDDHLTLTDKNKRSIDFIKEHVDPMADVKVEFLAAIGINDAGELLVTEFLVHRASRSDAPRAAPTRRTLRTKSADVFLVRESGLGKVSVDEARRLIRDPTPVVVAYRPDGRPSPLPSSGLWKETDSAAVGRTISRVLRPGTLVFVVPQSAKMALQP